MGRKGLWLIGLFHSPLDFLHLLLLQFLNLLSVLLDSLSGFEYFNVDWCHLSPQFLA